MLSTFSSLLSLLPAFSLATGSTPPASIDIIAGVPTSGPSTVRFTSQSTLFDAPKVKGLNSTSWEWWYFDVVSSDLDYSLVVVFFTSTPESLWPGIADVGSADFMVLALTGPDGTSMEAGVAGQELTVVTVANGSSGVLSDSSTGWMGTPNMSFYSVVVDAPASGVSGTISFKSIAPAHFPCAPATAAPGQRLNLGPTPIFGWLNAIPDADAVVDLNINGTKFQFSGPGYHDKNWGSQPLHTSVNSWYWGHARLGPFSFVWFDFVAPDGTELVSTYMARDNQIMSSTCDGATVRPMGAGEIFPPTSASSMQAPEGFNITAVIEGEGTLIMKVTHRQAISSDPGTTWRWIGEVSGGFGNGTTWEGVALYEQFTFDNWA